MPLFEPAFDSCDAPDAARVERLRVALPVPLADLLRDELAHGNVVRAIASGHPAPPVGVLVRLVRPVATVADETLAARGLVRRPWGGPEGPVGWSDARGFCWLMEPDPPRPAAPALPRPAAAYPTPDERFRREAAARVGPSPALRAWSASRTMDYERWRDGTGYDLDALAALTDIERASVEMALVHGIHDWRDVEALAALDTPRARQALARTLRDGTPALRMAVLRHAPSLATLAAEAGVDAEALRTDALVHALTESEHFGGLSAALDEAAEHHPPAVVAALWRGLSTRDGGTAVHFAALLAYLHGLAAEPFDWALRPFFLRFHTDDATVRAAMIAELRERIAQRQPEREQEGQHAPHTAPHPASPAAPQRAPEEDA